MNYRIFFALLLLPAFSCMYKKKENKVVTTTATTFIVQPFNGIDSNDVNYVSAELRKIIPTLKVNAVQPIPSIAYYEPRGRYRADSIIRILSGSVNQNEVVIGLTMFDISTSKGEIKDWGVMGLGYCPGKACVASSFRLSPQNRQQQFFKVAIHELGHTQGLAHCANKTCLMRDAEGSNHLDEETGFCEKCKAVLVKKGWKL